MAIVYMNKRVDKLMNQLDLYDDLLYPNPQHFSYQEKEEVYLYDVARSIMLRDFEIIFKLIIKQTGDYAPGEGLCKPESFTVETTELKIEDLKVYDNVYGEYLKLSRAEFTEVVNKVKPLIQI